MRIVVPYLENKYQARLLFTFSMFSEATFSKNFYFNYTTEYITNAYEAEQPLEKRRGGRNQQSNLLLILVS